MNSRLQTDTNNLEGYLEASDIMDYHNPQIAELSDKLEAESKDTLDYIKQVFLYVRDNISHSGDINKNLITVTASEVLREGHGICYCKSHLLAALLRRKKIPAGLCYQKLVLDDFTAPILVLHGLNAVYIEEIHAWIRLDARGNKEGVDAQFSIDKEKLAFPVRPELGEKDYLTIFSRPDANVLGILQSIHTRTELWENLPQRLAKPAIEG